MRNCRRTIVFTGVISIITIITTWLIATNTRVHELTNTLAILDEELKRADGLAAITDITGTHTK